MTNKISLYFLGTDDFAATVLKRIIQDNQFDVLGVVTPPDKKVGRKQVLTPCEVKVLANSLNLKVIHNHLDLIGKNMDFLVAVSYGYFLPKEVLSLPKYESLNVHASLLPRYRGASPIQAAILNGDNITGVSIMKMVKKMDGGAVFAVSEAPIRNIDTNVSLRMCLADIGAELLAQVMPSIKIGNVEAQVQNESLVTVAPIIKRDDGFIDWMDETASEIDRKKRAYLPWPGIYTNFNEKRLKILKAYAKDGSNLDFGKVELNNGEVVVGTKKGLFVLEEIQLEGKQPLLARDFVRGYPNFLGTVLK